MHATGVSLDFNWFYHNEFFNWHSWKKCHQTEINIAKIEHKLICLVRLHKESNLLPSSMHYNDVIKRKHFLCYWPFVRGIHRSPGNSPHKGQWRGALMFSLICIWTNGSVNNREAGDLRCRHAHYDVTVMEINMSFWFFFFTGCREQWQFHQNDNSSVLLWQHLHLQITTLLSMEYISISPYTTFLFTFVMPILSPALNIKATVTNFIVSDNELLDSLVMRLTTGQISNKWQPRLGVK